jgi:peptidoglycan/xylan/chitin deacetylase (PgdA/CDA1 family)
MSPGSRTVFELALIGLIAWLVIHPLAYSPLWRLRVTHRAWVPEKVVALTFDDGPHPIYTPALLKVLDHYGVKATFFMIGKYMEKYPEIVKQVAADGHAIGNHTYDHPYSLARDSPAQIIGELEHCEEIIERLTGRRTHIFRPPRGMYSGRVVELANAEGYRTILWSISADHHEAPTPELMAQRVLTHIRPGAIILAHDGQMQSRWKDLAATPLIIEGLQKKGYRFVTIPELLRLAKRR